MGFDQSLRSGETLVADLTVAYGEDGGKPLRLLLTDQRARWPGKKLMAVKDDIVTHEAAAADVVSVALKRPSGLSLFGAAAVLLIVGLVWTFAAAGDDSIYIGMPTVMILVSPIYPLLGRRKRVIRFSGHNGVIFKWTSPIAFGRKARDNAIAVENGLRAWSTAIGKPFET